MYGLNHSFNFAMKRLDINALYNDESLFHNFEFKSSFQDKINKTQTNDYIYNKPFKDDDMNQFQGYNNNIKLNRIKSDLNLNFGQDPYIVNKNLMKNINNNCFDNNLKNKVLKYWWSISSFSLFEYFHQNSSGDDKCNKTLELNSQNCIPYMYYNYIFSDNYKLLLRKTILPVKYINHVSVVIKDNKLLKKIKRKNRIIIMNNINIENMMKSIKIKK